MTKAQRTPSSEAIVREAAQSLGLYELPTKDVRASFDELLSELSATTLALYEQYEERQHAPDIARRMISDHPTRVAKAERISKRKGFHRGAFVLLKSLYPDLRGAFLSVSQGRKARGGKSFEKQFELLLESAGYSFKPQEERYRTDLVFPSEEAFNQNRVICVVASLKRTLRERWQEVVGELTQLAAPNVYLVTADPQSIQRTG